MALSGIVVVGAARSNPGLRVEVSEPTRVRLSGELAFLLNLSEAGMAVQARRNFEPAEVVEFALSLPQDNEVTGTAVIVWSDCSGKTGLKFIDIAARDRLQLQLWLRQKEDAMWSSTRETRA